MVLALPGAPLPIPTQPPQEAKQRLAHRAVALNDRRAEGGIDRGRQPHILRQIATFFWARSSAATPEERDEGEGRAVSAAPTPGSVTATSRKRWRPM